ncbi:MAG TPA: DUF1501 domain-containing protein [Pirellulales bacterium]
MCGIHHLQKFAGPFSRRDLLRLSLAGAVGVSTSGWFESLARAAIDDKNRRRSCILLWMNGGPSQMDTFDLKPGTRNGGLFKNAGTDVTGMNISEHLPQLSKRSKRMAIVRSMTAKEGDHGRATQFVRTGYVPGGPIHYPTLGSLVAKELGRPDAELPNFVSIAPNRTLSPAAYTAGFLGAGFAPLIVGERAQAAAAGADDSNLIVEDIEPPAEISADIVNSRLKLLDSLNAHFLESSSDAPANSYKAAYERAVELMQSKLAAAFKLDEEPAVVRDAYGRTRFGQGCLLARRLVERGVPFVEVTLGAFADAAAGWDTHTDNFEQVRKLSGVLDPAWATLMRELAERGLLDSTLIVWMGEFGRTPQINSNGGRDHFPQAFSSVLAGGGIRGGQVIGKTSDDGMSVQDRPVTIPDFLATICHALGIDPTMQNTSDIGRPIRIVDPAAKPITEVLS